MTKPAWILQLEELAKDALAHERTKLSGKTFAAQKCIENHGAEKILKLLAVNAEMAEALQLAEHDWLQRHKNLRGIDSPFNEVLTKFRDWK